MVTNKAYGGHALSIQAGIAVLVILMLLGGAGAAALDNEAISEPGAESNIIASTMESEWSSKPLIVNLQVDLEDEQDVKFILPVLAEIDKRNWITTVYVTGEVAEKYPNVVKAISERGHYVGVNGWKKGENLSELNADEQLKLINKSIILLKSNVINPSSVVDFKSQNFAYNNDTIQILQNQKIKSITGVFDSNESFCKCWYAKSVGKITFPYPITNDFVAVPVSTVQINSREILLKDEVIFENSSVTAKEYLDYLLRSYEAHNRSKDPLVIEIQPSVTGADGNRLESLTQFLDYVSTNNGVVKPTAPITIMGGYISNLDASGPESAFPDEQITLRVDYTSTLYCPTYYFRAFGKYPNGGWTYLGQTSYYVTTGPHTFNMQVKVPKPPKDDNKLTIRVVGRACKDVCWPDVNNYEAMDELLVNIKTDLNISSPDIIISPSPHKISAKVYNKGDASVENVEVKFIDKVGNKEARSAVKTIAKINAREFGTASSDWIIDLGHDYEVDVDPLNKIKESDENNNRAQTHKIKGTVKDSSGNILNKTRFDYMELDGANWQKKYTGFTDESGRYNITVNLDVITSGKKGKVNATLEFSPTQKIADIRFRIFDDSEWGAGTSPRAGANPIQKNTSEWVMNKSRDYNGDIAFNPHNGTIAYRTLIQSYGYFKRLNIAREQLIQIEVNNDDVAACNDDTSCWIPANNVITFWHTRSDKPSTIAHEYSHAVSDPWNTPYEPIDENWANYGSVISRGTNIYNWWGYLVDVFDDDHTDGSAPPAWAAGTWNFQLAGTYSKLSRDHVITTMRRDGPRDLRLDRTANNRTNYSKSFYLSYRTHDTSRTSASIKRIFRNHGFRTAGWPGSPSPENSSFSDAYKHYKVDENGDYVAESLNIDVGVNISAQGNYTTYGYLIDSSGSGYYSYAKNITWLNAGFGNVTLSFNGSSIYQNRLNGSYSLVDLYLMYNDTQIDYRETAFITSAYKYTEFFRPAVIPTGIFGDKGVDTDSDGLFDYLELGILMNASAAGNYSIRGSLYDSASDKIQDIFGYGYLNAGLNWMNLTVEGETLYANGRNGSYVLSGLYITGEQEAPVYSDDRVLYDTSSYNFTSFKPPSASFTGIVNDSGTDSDVDGFFDYLTLNISIESKSSANVTLNGYLYNGSEFITSGYIATFINTGTQSIMLDIDGRTIRENKANNSYNITLELSDINGTLIGKIYYTTAFYNYTQFQPLESEYFNITYSDQGTDSNGDLLYDNLTVNLSIYTIVPGNYSIEGYLYNKNGSFVAYAGNNANLTACVTTVQLNFDGKELWKTRIINGSYNLTLKIYGINYTHAVDLKDAYITATYNYTQFQKPKGAFDLFFYGYGRDLDGNGLYDYLTIDAAVNVTSSGNYTLSGLLADANGSEIVWTSNLSYLGAGNRTVSLDFDGMHIYEHRINGTYTLRSLSLNDANGSTIDFIDNAFVTQQYNYTEFQIGGTIKGWVKDSSGAPVYDAIVKASGISNSSVNTDTSGSYSIPALKTGSYFVSVSPPAGSNLTGSSSVVYVTAGNVYVVNFTMQRGARILGTVTDSNGTSVPNVLVQLSGAAYASTNTGINGSYAIEGLNAGSYTVYVVPQPTINLMDNSTPITLTANQTMLLNFTLQSAGSIGGVVTDKNGTPMPDVILYLSGYETPRFRTDANGSYIIPRLTAGTYTVNVDAADRGFFENSSSVSVILGQTSIVNFTLQKGGIITGNVTASNGTAVANAYVYVYSGPTYRTIYTNVNGSYTLGPLLAGNYTIRANPPSESDLVYNTTAVSVALGETKVANIILPRGGIITGNVTTSNGTAVANAYVYSSGPTYKSTYTSANGSFSLAPLLAGSYTIYASPPYGSELVGNSTTIEVALEQTTSSADIILPAGGIITGRVTYANGTGIANAYVYSSGPTYRSAYTNSTGGYTFISLLGGNYTIYASPPYGTNLLSNSTSVSVSLGETSNADNIILPEGGVITGRVTYANGTGIANAYVYSSGPMYRSAYTNSTGGYTFISLLGGNYTIYASPPYGSDLLSNSTSVIVSPGETSNADIILKPAYITPPAGVTNLRNVSHAPNYINWTWTDPVDVDFSHVTVYIDWIFRTNVSSGVQFYNATGFSAGTAHTISTRTVGTGGSINETWVNHTATTNSSGEIKGDLNRNGRRDTGDATLMLRTIVELPIPSQYQPVLPVGDMNCNNRIDTGDATLVLRDVVSLPIPKCWE